MKKLFVLLLLVSPVCLKAQTKSKSKVIATAGITVSVTRGEKVYKQYCLSCHQADGGGVPNMNPPLSKTSYVTGDKVRLIKVVLNGFTQNVDIDGESYSNNMPPHNFLKDQEIADVLTYIRNNFTNKATAITIAQVKATRAANKK
ncbi:cytochrome c [Mucilaginibacter mali]|uniref:Cytochrome c n=1 Tax=Mucilaginibacter mali TaxID=2740462 RepID=A0A7D4UD75_9SPHI|nr:cytochrome c [Mucilaginibacter mali]QKJ30259.1 cytochrome c [Mucilaginibacter mali]